MARVPGLEPGPDAVLEVGDHALGDTSVEVCARRWGGGFHRRSPFAGVTSRKERAVPAARSPVRGNGHTGALRSRAWPHGGAGRMERAAVERAAGGFRRAATVTLRKEQMKTAA